MKEMRDILPKEKIEAADDTLSWYLEDLLLTYKYNYKDKFFRDLNALRPFLSRQVYILLYRIGEARSWKKGGSL